MKAICTLWATVALVCSACSSVRVHEGGHADVSIYYKTPHTWVDEQGEGAVDTTTEGSIGGADVSPKVADSVTVPVGGM